MKAAVSLLLVVALGFGAYKLWEYQDWTRKQRETSRPEAVAGENGQRLPGMDPALESSLQQAKAEGAEALKVWIDHYQRLKALKDPRLAWIELDYVTMLSSQDPVRAKKMFAAIKQRVAPDSPVYPRLQELQKTYD